MRAVLIINPVSGDAEPNSDKVPVIERLLQAAGWSLEVAYTSEERKASQLAREAVSRGVEFVLVGGGDGTVSEVAREVARSSTTLGILPIGTFNNIARSLAIPTELEEACGIIAQGKVRAMDLGVANGTDYFFEAAGTGLDATLFPIGEEIKGGRWTRVFQAARLTFQYKVQPIAITFDRPVGEALAPGSRVRLPRRVRESRTIYRNALLVVVANGPYYGGGFNVSPDARMSDGRLTVSIYRNFSKVELIRHFWAIAYGRHRYSPKIESYFAKEVRLDSPVLLPVHVDGQPYGQLPISLSTLPGALKVLAPARTTPRAGDAVALPGESAAKSGEVGSHAA
jgi:diacylglycerol kinase (ATP)